MSVRRRLLWGTLLVGTLAGGLLIAPRASRAAPDRAEQARAELKKRKQELLVAASRRHVELGIWCRDAGLVSQAAKEFVRAVEVSEGADSWAVRILDLMRRMDERFWRKVMKNPGPAYLRTYEKRTRTAEESTLEDRVALAKWAAKKKDLGEESFAEYQAVVRLTDRPIVTDAAGVVTLPTGPLPPEISERLLKEAVTINGRRWVRDAFLARMPEITELAEAESEALRVRTQGGEAQAKDLLGICLACLPFLEADTGGRPTSRMQVFVFAKRADYETYLDRAGMPEHKRATGVADGGTFTTVIAGEGLDLDALHGVTLHEMSHLYQYGVTPVIMPSWYAEGFAETYGGAGTFTWDGTTLTSGGVMAAHRLEPLRTPEGYIPFSTLFSGDALRLINEAKGGAPPFYAESWALRRWLRSGAPAEIQERFALWETMCRGGALGAEVGKPNGGDASPASQLFQKLLGDALPALEPAFQQYLATLR
jgi:hypothetical protein